MDDLDNVLVLTIFAVSVVAVIVGYLLAWRAQRTAYRRAGSLMTAVVAGFAGLFMLAWLRATRGYPQINCGDNPALPRRSQPWPIKTGVL